MSGLRPQGSDSREKQTENTRVAPVLWRPSAAAFFRSDTGRGGGCRSEKKSCGKKVQKTVDVETLQRHIHGGEHVLPSPADKLVDLRRVGVPTLLPPPERCRSSSSAHLQPYHALLSLSNAALFFPRALPGAIKLWTQLRPESYRIMIRLKVAR